jgi:hypothetical protein
MNAPDRVSYFASADIKGVKTPFGIKQKDRSRHMYVVGKTGTGKSTILDNLMIQDIKNGEGFACIDTHGASVEKLLDCIPQERIEDVVYIAPHLPGHAVPFNVLEDVPATKHHVVVSGLLPIFKDMWRDVWSSQFEYVLTNVLLVLLAKPEAHLLHVHKLFTDKAFRTEALTYTKNDIVRHFFEAEFENEVKYQDVVRVIVEKVHQMSLDPLMCDMLGQSNSGFDMRDIIDRKKILLVHIPKGFIGETNTRILGGLFSARLFAAAMARGDLSVEDLARVPEFHFYADEFQNIGSGLFATMLSEARKYKLDFILANQYMHQLSEDIRNAIFANIGTIIMFRIAPSDVELLKKVFSPTFTEDELHNVGLTQIYLSLTIDGAPSKPFVALSIPPIEKPVISHKEVILERTMTQLPPKQDDTQSLKDILTEVRADTVQQEEERKVEQSKTLKSTLEEVLQEAKAPPASDKPFEVPEQELRNIFKSE